jgi:glucose-1-phosphate cytidylyltransferase
MKVLILAGGFGTRLSEETASIPKPMVEIGGKPILWHIMKIYSAHGFNEFVILLGYKGYVIKEYFANYFLHTNDVTFDMRTNEVLYHENRAEDWRVTLLDTGANTMTGGRVKRAAQHIGNQPFMLTYGDGVADVDIRALAQFHAQHGKLMTMTAVQPDGRFGALNINPADNAITSFQEKPKGDSHWINGGFFVCQPQVLDYIAEDSTILEREPLESLARQGQLVAYRHESFWQCMDTLRDKQYLEKVWQANEGGWKIW